MNLFVEIIRRVFAALGWGGVSVGIELDEVLAPRGGEVSGKVILTGGSFKQRIHTLKIKLIEFSGGNRQQYSKMLSEHYVTTTVSISPKQRLEFPFKVTIPDYAGLTKQSMGSTRQGCNLQAEAWLGFWSSSPSFTAALEVVEHREIEAVKVAILSLGFSETPWFLHHLTAPSGKSVSSVAYSAPPRLREHLDGISAILDVEGGFVTGRIIFNIRESNIAERLKAMFGGNRLAIPVSIPRGELITRDGKPKYQAALPHLERIIDEAMRPLLNDPKYRLLRPTEAPVDANILLRPAGTSRSEPEHQLLRPTIGPESDAT